MEPQQPPMDDYLIDGIEKQVPLLPETTDVGTMDELTPSLQELVSPPEIPRRPIRHESMESQREQGTADDHVPNLPKRPVRKMSIESVEEPGLRRQVSQRSQASVDDEPLMRQSSIKSVKSPAQSEVGERQQTPSAEEPFIPPRPIRKLSITSVPEKDVESEMEPIIPPRPTRVSDIKTIPKKEPKIPPRPKRASSIKSIPDTSIEPPDGEKESEPFVPPRPTKKSSIKSIPDTAAEPPEVETESEPFIPARPTRISSIKSIPEITTPEPIPISPPRPTRKSSVKSFKSQHSIEDESTPAVGVHHPMESSVDIPVIPQRPKKAEHKHEEPEETQPPAENVPISPPQLPVIPVRPKKHESTEPTPTQDDIAKPEEDSVQDVPVIPRRPKTSEEPPLRPAGFAAPPTIPAIPHRPIKVRADPTLPKVTMDETPEIVRAGGGIYESAEKPTDSTSRQRNEAGDVLNIKHSTPKEVTDTSISKEANTPAAGIQSEVASSKSRMKSPPIPARPQHKLAKQFEQIMVKEKPAPPPRPVKPAVGTSSRFAGIRAQFAKDLNERLAKPPPPPPVQKKEEEEVHSVVEKKEIVPEEKDIVVDKVGDVRKGRAKGPQRRPPTVKPIIPAGWGVSVISTLFEQPVVAAFGMVEKELSGNGKDQEPSTENRGQMESSGLSEKSEEQTKTRENTSESENGVKAVVLEGGVATGNGVEDVGEPMKVEDESKGVDLSESMEAKEIVSEVQHEEQVPMVESPERERFEE